jgi:predicted CXXCH cytochrome family protein
MRRGRTIAAMTALLVAALVAGMSSIRAEDGGQTIATRTPIPSPPKAQGEHCVADTAFMRRYHMQMLLHQRQETVHDGVRTDKFSLAQCVSCHAVKGSDGAPVAYSDSKHFCRSCHDYAAVSVDCFTCHASRPDATKQTARAIPPDHLASGLNTYLREVGR